jgi:hypothetical protein
MQEEKIIYKEFTGTPAAYLKICVALSVGLNLFIYLGMVGLLYGLNDQEWILGWKPAVIALVFAAWFARAAYRWIMRLDAQYGSGRGWTLDSQMVKLPDRATRPRG